MCSPRLHLASCCVKVFTLYFVAHQVNKLSGAAAQ